MGPRVILGVGCCSQGEIRGQMKGRVTLGETQGGEGGGTANTNPRWGQRGWSPKAKRKDRRGAGASPHPRPARPTPSRHLDRRSC